MEEMRNLARCLSVLLLLVGSVAIVTTAQATVYSDLHFVVSSSQECPAPTGAPTAVGRGFVTYKSLDDPTTGAGTGSYRITLTGALTSAQTAQHIHAGTATVCPSDPNVNNRPVLFALAAPVSGTMSGTFGPLTAAQEAALLQTSAVPGQRPYINVHTSNNPGGEIRGNLNLSADAPGGVPSLSEWGMIILAALLVVTGTVFVLRRRRALA
jgi:CHRD domain/IPTL-CTERM motif